MKGQLWYLCNNLMQQAQECHHISNGPLTKSSSYKTRNFLFVLLPDKNSELRVYRALQTRVRTVDEAVFVFRSAFHQLRWFVGLFAMHDHNTTRANFTAFAQGIRIYLTTNRAVFFSSFKFKPNIRIFFSLCCLSVRQVFWSHNMAQEVIRRPLTEETSV
jgi:hypothetical protein